ncbi:MAG: MAPEG family protein [Myxococcales bacterium]|nr:MAPEG family protein [Myxococcales bacterium]
MTDIHYLVFSAVLTWIMIMTAAELHTPTWTRAGAKLAFGNRDHLPERSPLAARADRAAKNMVDNLALFVALFVAARAAGADPTTGAAIFFFSRLSYFALYLAGVVLVRSLAWGVSLLGLGWIALAALR